MGGGNSLLDCVVFGRVSGKAAAKYILGDAVKETSLADLSGGGLSGKVEASKLSGGSYEDGMNKAGSAAPAAKPAEAPVKEKKSSGGGGGLTMAEVAKHTTKTDCWVVLSGNVLNVTNFLSQHPGGELAILTFAGKDATAEFDMIHPPDVVGKYAPDAIIGKVGEGGGGDDEEEDDDAAEGAAKGGDVEKGNLSRSKSIRTVVKAPPKPGPKHEENCIGWHIGQIIDGMVWHVKKMDGCTWWIVILTMVFVALVAIV